MKKAFLLLITTITSQCVWAQGIVLNSGATINVTSGTNLRVVNSFLANKAGGSINNDGTIYLDSTYQQSGATYTGGAASWLWFEGTSNQSIIATSAPTIARLKVDNAAGVTLTQDLNISDVLMLTQGTLDLNSHNVDLGATGVLLEGRAANRTVVDNTSGLSQSNKGGYIRASSRSTNSTLTEVAGMGIHLADAGTVSIDRYHYQGTSVGSGGIKKVYEVSGTPTNAQMRIEFSANELGTMANTNALQLYHFNGSTWDKHTSTWNNALPSFVDGTGINSFSPWTVGEEPPLPIQLLRFEGNRKNPEIVTLNWKTASEINNNGFEVEMSADNQRFEKVTFVKGAGNSNKSIDYQTNVPQADAAYFRLKQIDADGKFSYSHSVFVGTERQTLAASIYPNPNKGNFTLLCNGLDQSTGSYEISNALGQMVASGVVRASSENLILNNLPAGMYFVKIAVGETITLQKMEITK
ncbi:Por secretion system C-terminal sorting domain-containing protein [Flexibacter flexilis DSM 6793]|uniref:Por secretion system C-terminal sorting domain-containing protein n=1 Tax=Flexibacter flexilis DSM 6793 TaxID=927664 RepID=A0A1I1FID1_9BACT|nr:T9SS type A sorting domain-containing protein [Flexibacter flexilis]SFB96883.1 Por secretion system C-terminal sorting domain-containing protein [Flexibacter flexilis DSM 6793]